jgi:hypothetical protein
VALGLLDLHPLELAGTLGVAEVGEEPDSVRLDEQGCVGAVETGQVEDVDGRRDEQRLLQQLAQAVYARARNSNASL